MPLFVAAAVKQSSDFHPAKLEVKMGGARCHSEKGTLPAEFIDFIIHWQVMIHAFRYLCVSADSSEAANPLQVLKKNAATKPF